MHLLHKNTASQELLDESYFPDYVEEWKYIIKAHVLFFSFYLEY